MSKRKKYRFQVNEDWMFEIHDIIDTKTGIHLPPDTFKGQALMDVLSEKRTLEDIKRDKKHEDYIERWVPSKGLILIMSQVPTKRLKKIYKQTLENMRKRQEAEKAKQ